MARRESVASGGFFPTPKDVLNSLLNGMFELGLAAGASSSYPRYVLDPCAGDGRALTALVKGLKARPSCPYINMLAVEMEASRAVAAREGLVGLNANANYVLVGDYLTSRMTGPRFATLVYLNPPYDVDRAHGRLEERFLVKVTEQVVPGGVVVFVVPRYALAASARTLAQHYGDLRCWKFPRKSYDAFKQVVLVARYDGDRLTPDEEMQAQVLAWARESTPLEDLPRVWKTGGIVVNPRVIPPTTYGEKPIEVQPMDLNIFQKMRDPWGGMLNYSIPEDVISTFRKKHLLAVPPRETHVAAALAAGVLNGFEVEPNESTSGLPAVLVKGTFHKILVQVDEKRNKDDVVTSRTLVERPRVSVCVLNLETGEYLDVPSDTAIRDLTPDLSGITMGSFLEHYGIGLMRGILESCPRVHDASRDEEVTPDLARPLFRAQKSALNALIKMRALGDVGALLLGEVGSGKTSVALALGSTTGAKKILVMCPPHLLDSWKNEIKTVTPWYQTMVLENISDARRFSEWDGGPMIGILSREKAKLGHGWEAVKNPLSPKHVAKNPASPKHVARKPSCPRCAARITAEDLAKAATGRLTCRSTMYEPLDAYTRWLANYIPALLQEQHKVTGRVSSVELMAYFQKLPHGNRKKPRPLDKARFLIGLKGELIAKMGRHLSEGREEQVRKAVVWLGWAMPELSGELASAWERSGRDHNTVKVLLCADLNANSRLWPEMGVDSEAHEKFAAVVRAVRGEDSPFRYGTITTFNIGEWKLSSFGINGLTVGGESAEMQAIYHALELRRFASRPCGEPLYQAISSPNRYPLASWLARKGNANYDLLILDEAHELSNDDSAQTRARMRLQAKAPFTVCLTGSLVNGYAESAFENLYSVSREFRSEYGRDGRRVFVESYGYYKIVVQEDESRPIPEALRGLNSDRVMGRSRRAGMVPGVQPRFYMDCLLRHAVTLQKADLELDLQLVKYESRSATLLPEQNRQHQVLITELMARVKEDKHDPELSGRLWGAVTKLASFPDLACSGVFELRYPENVGGELVTSQPGLDPGIRLPKEQLLVDSIREELKEDRPCLVLAWHQEVIQRLLRVLEEEGIACEYLNPAAVPTAKRQAWIDRKVIKPNQRVLVSNPTCIQTGLNNLVHFATEIWFENPTCNALILRQAIGRIDRPGQKKEPRVIILTYDEVLQQKARQLLLHKAAVSELADGLDPSSVFAEVGIEDDTMAGLAVGRQLFKMLTGE